MFRQQDKIIGICPRCGTKIKWLERQVKKRIRKAIQNIPPDLKADLSTKEAWCSKCIIDYLEPIFESYYARLPQSEIDKLNPIAKKLLRRALERTGKKV